MAHPIVYGPAMSTYVWSARLALAEKGVTHELVDVHRDLAADRFEAAAARRAPLGRQRAAHDDAFGHTLEQHVDRDRRAGRYFGGNSGQTVERDRLVDLTRVPRMAERGSQRDAQGCGGGRHDCSLGAPGGPVQC